MSMQINRYFSIFIFLFGTIGNILNCVVLSQPTLRVNPCAYLFLISSIANMISILFGLTTRILAGWNIDITDTNSLVCKFRAFIVFVSRTIAFWLIAFATIDRWFSSCSQYQRRQMSSLKNAQRGTIIIIILSILLYCQMIYCYEANMSSTPLPCYGKNVVCRFLTDLTYAIITILCPLLIMFIFGLITISNIRQTCTARLFKKKLIVLNGNNKNVLISKKSQQQRKKRIDRYLRHVLFIQIIFLSILTIPQAIEKFYTTLSVNATKSLLNITINKFIYNFVLLLTYLASGLPFYIYTLSGGSTFRVTLINSLQSILEKLTCR
ncbi:unnamed protein product [Rotaria sp. Silwood1]|nr:unnamed protein product [Rotaria sp. Silwood1]CAF1009330.1 unnamed protein product [Rotaria sp. Silwood1]CAF1017986.1 unnamed protein product [Rotaria sp. Silwood1]CAF3398440.1 unnamed protein product [Rotaria sp. Silwood1]CAF3422731.1 unnamed protein product [Rotaria sp. Silwood1]